MIFKKSISSDDYYAQANTWSSDIYANAVMWRNWCLLISILALSITICALALLIKILPLKENTPFLVFVDQERGEPVTIKPVSTQDLIENSSLKKYMITKFITARERYYPATLDEDAQVVTFLSDETVAYEYRQSLPKSNPLHLANIYKDSTVDVGKMNILFLNENRAYVSYELIVHQELGAKKVAANADIKFQFAQREMPVDAAEFINPVNFEVLSYQSHYQNNHNEENL